MSWKVENRGASRRVVVTKELPGSRWKEALVRADCEIHVSGSREALSVGEIRDAIGERCDGAIGQLTETWGSELFEALQRAGGKVYSNYAVGYDNVDVGEATSRKLAVGNTPGVLTETTAELAVALTFAAARRVPESERFLREGKFDGWLPDLFLGKLLWKGTLGIVGSGRIGGRYAKMMALGHAMNVLYWDVTADHDLEEFFKGFSRFASANGEPEVRCQRAESFEDLLRESDVVSLHVPLNSSTRHLINADSLSLMKEDAVLVNTSRGPVIDEAALVAHLRRRPAFRAGLDVFENEPALAPGLAELPNVVVVPHIGSATVWTREGMATLAAANVAGILQGYPVAKRLRAREFLEGDFPEKTPSIVNREKLGIARG